MKKGQSAVFCVWFEYRVTVQHYICMCVTKMRFSCVCVFLHENMGVMIVPPEHTERERGSNYLDTGVAVISHLHTLFSALSLLFCDKVRSGTDHVRPIKNKNKHSVITGKRKFCCPISE